MKKLIYLLIPVLVYSCNVVKIPNDVKTDLKELNSSNFQEINGYYSFTETDKGVVSTFFENTIPNEKYLIKIELESKKLLKLKLFDDELLIDSVLIKGKLKKNYFKVKTEHSTESSGFPLWHWSTVERKIYLKKDDSLFILDYSSSAGYILFIPAAGANGWDFYSLKKAK